nr:AMP-binding protein [Gammaproteobacteria bacterium]
DVYQQDVALSLLPLSHTFERTCGYYLTMMAGCTVAYARSIPQLAEDMQVIRPTVLIAVPRVFERVYARLEQQLERRSLAARVLFRAGVAVGWRRFEAQQGRARRSPVLVLWSLLDRLVARKLRERFGGRLRLAISGGAALNPDVARTFLGLGITVLQGYGLTEAAPIVSANTLHDNRPASVGVPVRGVRVRLGENDELLVRSPGVMLGYWNDHNATKRAIDPEGWLHTGDKARTEEGHIYITGRLKDILVLSNGEKVAPVEMELAITLDPLFDHAMVVGEGRPFLGALLVINSEKWFGLAREIGLDPFKPASLRDAKLQQLVVKRLRGLLRDFPGYAKIRRVTLLLDEWSVDNGLLTPTLKLKREQVLERYRRETERLYAELHGGARRAGA